MSYVYAPSIKSLMALTVAAALSGCGKLPGFAVDAKTDAFVQEPQINDKIDILFVVDNSGSMAEEQQNLADSFSQFIEKFADRRLDFQVGVTASDVTNNSSYWAATGSYVNGAYKNFANAGPGSLLAYRTGGVVNERILTPDTPNYIDKFKQNVKIGIIGSGAEAGLYASNFFFGEEKMANWNAGFVRPEALLAVIFLSDEDESRGRGTTSDQYVKVVEAERTTRVNEFKATMTAIKPDPDLLRVDAIVAPSQAECPTVYNDNGHPGTGDVYIEVAQFFGGGVSNICQNFADDLALIGDNLLTLLTRFKLVQKPDGQIEVRVNGEIVPRDPVNGWEYLADSQEVEFRGDAVPASDATIEVSYVPGEPLR